MGCQPTDIGEVHMIILELFFGNGSFSRAALDLGHEVVGIGIDPCPKDIEERVDYYERDILKFPYKVLRHGEYDYVWASPPCETYSMVAIQHGLRDKCLAVTEKARLHDSYVLRALDIIAYLEPKYYTIENPRACLRKQPFMEQIPRVTVAYCQYGGDRMKPTDLFGDLPSEFIPKMCKNGSPCHIPAPRGSKNNQDASVPYDLCRELLELAEF